MLSYFQFLVQEWRFFIFGRHLFLFSFLFSFFPFPNFYFFLRLSLLETKTVFSNLGHHLKWTPQQKVVLILRANLTHNLVLSWYPKLQKRDCNFLKKKNQNFLLSLSFILFTTWKTFYFFKYPTQNPFKFLFNGGRERVDFFNKNKISRQSSLLKDNTKAFG